MRPIFMGHMGEQVPYEELEGQRPLFDKLIVLFCRPYPPNRQNRPNVDSSALSVASR